MAVLVVLLAVVVALLALLVAGLLRSHAEILRALHQLGVNMDPAQDDGAGVTTPVGSPVIRSAEVPKRPSGRSPDSVKACPPLRCRLRRQQNGPVPSHRRASGEWYGACATR